MAARFLFLCFRIRLERDQEETRKRPKRDLKERKSEGEKPNRAIWRIFKLFAGLPPPFPASSPCVHENDPDGFGRAVNPFRLCGMQAVVRK